MEIEQRNNLGFIPLLKTESDQQAKESFARLVRLIKRKNDTRSRISRVVFPDNTFVFDTEQFHSFIEPINNNTTPTILAKVTYLCGFPKEPDGILIIQSKFPPDKNELLQNLLEKIRDSWPGELTQTHFKLTGKTGHIVLKGAKEFRQYLAETSKDSLFAENLDRTTT